MSETHKHKYTKEEIESPDWFHLKVSQFREYALKHKKRLIIIGILLIILVTGIFGYFAYVNYAERQLWQKIAGIDLQLKTLDYKSEDDVNKILSEYRSLIDRNPGSVVVDYAGIRRAQIFNRLNFEDKTVEELLKISDDKASDVFYRSMATFKLVEIYRINNQTEEAIKILNDLSAVEFEDRKLFELGLIYLTAGNIDKAKANFTTLNEQFNDSVYREFADSILKTL